MSGATEEMLLAIFGTVMASKTEEVGGWWAEAELFTPPVAAACGGGGRRRGQAVAAVSACVLPRRCRSFGIGPCGRQLTVPEVDCKRGRTDGGLARRRQ